MTDLFQQNGTLDYFNNKINQERQTQLDYINNIVSPEFLEQERAKGKKTAFEVLRDGKKWGYAMPYIGTTKAIGESANILNIQNKVKDGIELTQQEKDKYKEFVLDMASSAVRGNTIPASAFDILLSSAPYAIEFGIGLATSESGVGLTSLASTGSKMAVRKSIQALGKDISKEAIKKGLAKNAVKTIAKDSTYGAGKFMVTRLPQQGLKRWGELEVDENLLLTPQGQVLLNEAEHNPATTFLKALALTYTDTVSETAGFGFNALNKVIGKKAMKLLPKNFASKFDDAIKKVMNMSGVKALEKYGFNGILEEFGEERVADFLNVTLDIDDEEGYSFEQYLNALVPPKEQILSELLGFALMGGSGGAIAQGADYLKYKTAISEIKNLSKNEDGSYNPQKMRELILQQNPDASEEKINKVISTIENGISNVEDYTIDDFLLDAGVFRCYIRKSDLDNKVEEILKSQNIEQDEIDNFLQFATNDDKKRIYKDFKSAPELNSEEDKKRTEIEEKVFEKFTQGGKVENNQSFSLSKMFGQYYKKYVAGNEEAEKKFDNWFNKLDVRYDVPVNSDNNTSFQNIFEDVYNITKDIILKGDSEKVSDLFDYKKELLPLKKYFSDVLSELRFRKMPEWMKENELQLGGHLHLLGTNTIYLNYEQIGSYENKEQQFFRTILHEMNHAKQYKLIEFAQKNKNNKTLSKEDRKKINEFLELNNASIKAIKEFKDFNKKHNLNKLKNNKELAKKYKEIHNKYANAYMETDADNVALALLAKIGKTNNELLRNYLSDIETIETQYGANIQTKELAQIYSFVDRIRKNGNDGLPQRLSDRIDTKTFFQKANPLDYDYIHHQVTGERIDLEINPELENRKDEIVESKELKDTKLNLLRTKENTPKLIEDSIKRYLFGKNKTQTTIKNNNTNKKAVINSSSVKEMINEVHNVETDIDNKAEFRKVLYDIVANSKELFESAEYILSYKEAKNEKLKEKQKIDKYANIVKTQFGDFIAEFTVFNRKDIGTVKIYDLESYQKNRFSQPRQRADKTGMPLTESNISITHLADFVKSRVVEKYNNDYKEAKNNKEKTYYQESNKNEQQLIAGYTQPEVMEKLSQLYIEQSEIDKETNEEEFNKVTAKIHILEDAFEANLHPEKYKSKNITDIMLNAYYVMNNEEIPEEYIDIDKKSERSARDYLSIHNEKKEKLENEYYGYFKETGDKNTITIMPNANASTALHELGHLFYNGLVELSDVSEEAKKQLEAVNKQFNIVGEATIEQMERFARSFEAYLYKGKAPNNYLRQVFENFKEWLKSVYQHIIDIPDAYLSKEVQEMFDNMFSDDSYYQERKEANELLNKVKKATKKAKVKEVKKANELDDTAKRHKKISYEILSVATGKDAKYLKTIFEGNSKGADKKREAILKLIDETADKIEISGGMREEWKEFYSYKNNELNAGYDIARSAFETILNKNYKNDNEVENELDERAQYYENAIDEADKQYKILLKEFKTGNRNVALSAMYDWLDSIDNQIKQDYEDRFIYDSAMIERDEKVDKFKQAKRNIIARALEVENQYGIKNDEKYKEVVKEIMKNLNFLSAEDKAKMTVNILDINNAKNLPAMIDNILDVAKTMEDVSLRRKLEQEIHKELQGTKNVKKNGRTVGKYNYKTNKIFEELRELDKLTPEKANDLRLENERFIKAEDKGSSYKDKLINKFLSYKAGGRTFQDTDLMKELYDEITKIKLIGKGAKSELELQEKLSETKDIDELIKIVENKKEAGKLLKGYIAGVANLESTINAIFNKEIKEKYASEILYAETQAQAWQHEQKQKFEREVARIYGLPEWCWDKKIIEYLAEKHTYSEIRRKYDAKTGDLLKTRNIDRTLTKMDIIQAYIWSKNEVLEKRLKNQFGEEQLDIMFDELSLEDVKLAELMMEMAQSFYPLVNKAFIRKYGLDLPKVSCYFPSTPERGSEVDLYNDYSSKSLNNSFTKQRAQSETQAMDFHNPVATLYNHIDGVSKFVFMSESLDKANLRFKDLDLKRVIINKFGKDAYSTLEQALMNVTYKKEAPVFNGMNKVIDNMVGNWIQANVAVKPIVGLKQLLSANNYAVDMPYMTWQKGFLEALAHPKQTIDYMMNIPYIKARYEGNFSNEFLKAQIENSAFAMSKKLKDACTVFIKMGDIGAIIFGGKPYIDYLIKDKGMSEDEAIKQFILSTNRSQQSSAISSLSNFQVNMSRNPMGRLFIAFKNSPQQYVRMCGDAIISVANGDMTKKQCAKILFQYAYLQPFLYAIATSGSLLRFLFTGDDDDLLKDASVSLFNLGSDAIPLLGDAYKYAINKILYKEKYTPQTTPLLGDIENEINKISKEDVELKDYLEAIGYLGLHVGLGYNSKAFTNMGSGVGDIATGQFGQGAMKILGYTERRSKHITGNEKKKTHK